MRYAIKDIGQVEFEFEVEALADFKYCLDASRTNLESQDLLAKRVEEAVCRGEELAMSQEEALAYVQPRMFTKGRNMYSQVKDPVLKLDFFNK